MQYSRALVIASQHYVCTCEKKIIQCINYFYINVEKCHGKIRVLFRPGDRGLTLLLLLLLSFFFLLLFGWGDELSKQFGFWEFPIDLTIEETPLILDNLIP